MATYTDSDASTTSDEGDESEMGKRSAELRADVVFLANKRPRLSDSPEPKDGDHHGDYDLKKTGSGEEESNDQTSGKREHEGGEKEDVFFDTRTEEKSAGRGREHAAGEEDLDNPEGDDRKPTASSDPGSGGSVAKKDESLALEDDFEKTHHTFPERLMELLENEEVKNAMWWLPGGDAFTIVPRLFPEMVLNKYFQGTKFESFTRKLNRWGFKRVAGQRVPQNTIAYHHPMFQQGSPELVKKMRSGRKRDNDAGRSLITNQLDRDLQAAALSSVAVANPYMGGFAIPIASLPPGLFGQNVLQIDQSALRPQLFQPVGSPLGQYLGWQSLIASQQSADLAAQRQAQLFAAERARLEQQQQEAEASELRRHLFGGSSLGFSQVPGRQQDYATILPATIVPLQQQQMQQAGLQPTIVTLPPAAAPASQTEQQRLLLMLLEQQRQYQDRNSGY